MIWPLLVIWLAGAIVCACLGREAWRAQSAPHIRKRIVLITIGTACLWPGLIIFAAACIALELADKLSELRAD